jgi:hypothetical protein
MADQRRTTHREGDEMSRPNKRASESTAAGFVNVQHGACIIRGTRYAVRRLTDVTKLNERIPLELALKSAAKLTVGRAVESLSGEDLTELGEVVSRIATLVLVAPDEISQALTEIEAMVVAQVFVVMHLPTKGQIQ